MLKAGLALLALLTFVVMSIGHDNENVGARVYRGHVSVGPETQFTPRDMLGMNEAVSFAVLGWLVDGDDELSRAMDLADKRAGKPPCYGRTYDVEFLGIHRKLSSPISGFEDEVRVMKVVRIKRYLDETPC